MHIFLMTVRHTLSTVSTPLSRLSTPIHRPVPRRHDHQMSISHYSLWRRYRDGTRRHGHGDEVLCSHTAGRMRSLILPEHPPPGPLPRREGEIICSPLRFGEGPGEG